MVVELLYAGRYVGVAPGAHVIGRDASCQFPLDDPSVSRRHAMLTVHVNGASIEDLGSRNGVVVDGQKANGRIELSDGNRIKIGNKELQIRILAGALAAGAPVGPPTPIGLGAVDDSLQRFQVETVSLESQTKNAGVEELEVLVDRADKALASGHPEQAERILSDRLSGVLASLRTGDRVDGLTVRFAATHALRLAGASRNPRWVDYVFDLYTLLDVLMPREIIDSLHRLVDQVGPIDLLNVDGYLRGMSRSQDDMDGQERALLRRVEQFKALAIKARTATMSRR